MLNLVWIRTRNISLNVAMGKKTSKSLVGGVCGNSSFPGNRNNLQTYLGLKITTEMEAFTEAT